MQPYPAVELIEILEDQLLYFFISASMFFSTLPEPLPSSPLFLVRHLASNALRYLVKGPKAQTILPSMTLALC